MKGKAWYQVKYAKGVGIVLSLCLLMASTIGGCPILWEFSLSGISALSVSEAGNYIAIGQDNCYYIFDTWGNLVGSGSVSAAVVSLDIANSGELIIGSETGYTFCTSDGTQISSFLSSPVTNVSISSEGTSSLVCCKGNLFINEENSMKNQLAVYSDFPIGAMSSNGSLACASSGRSLHIFSDGNFKDPYVLEDDANHLFVSADGKKIIFSMNNGKIGYINTENMELELKDLGLPILNMTMSCNGDTVLVSTTDRLIWLEKGSIVNEFSPVGEVNSLSLSGDNSLIIVGKGNNIEIMKSDGTPVFSYELEGHVVASEVSRNDLLVVCTENGIHTFQLFQKTKNANPFNPISSRKSLPLRSSLEQAWSVPVSENADFFTADVDGDGFIEIVLKEGSILRLIDENGKLKSMKDTQEPIVVFSPLDFDGDTVPELPLTFDSAGFIFLLYNWKREYTKAYDLESLGRNPDSREGMVIPFAVLDIDVDGKTEILAAVSMGYECKPRGIVSIDYLSGDIEWFYQMGPSVHSDVVEDIDGDGNMEVVLGSVAPCNCGNDDQFPDCEIYVTALSSAGKELWKVPLGEGYRRVEICAEDVDSEEGVEIIGFGYEASQNWGSLFVLNCFGEYLYKSEVNYSVFPGAVCDIDSDNTKEILTIDSRGYISIFTPDLKKKAERSIKDSINSRSQLYLNDINGDSFCEILLGIGRELFIFDQNLNILWQNEFEKDIKFTVVNFSRCKNMLLVLSDNLYAYSYQDYGESPCPLWVVTERSLLKEATGYVTIAESSYAAGEYRASKSHFERALQIFSELEDQEKKDYISEKLNELSEEILRQDIEMGIIFLVLSDISLSIFLLYHWIDKKRWYRSIEIILFLNFPVLLGFFQAYIAHESYISVFVRYFIPFFIFSSIILLRQKLLGFLRTVSAFLGGHKDMLVLSIVKQSDEVYRVSVESIEERFKPVKESREIMFTLKTKKELVKKVDLMIAALNQFSSPNTPKESLSYAENVLKEAATAIYHNFIPKGFSDILRAKFLLLEVEDVEIPWELMYSDNFIALKYAVSRRIVTTESVTIRPSPTKRGRRALVISNPSGNLPAAKIECEIVYKRLKQKMDVVYIEGNEADSPRIANQFGQGFDIIHFAGHVDNGLLLADGLMNPQDVREFLLGTPIVFVNGCRSEDLARAFLLGGAMAYVGTIHPIHDESAALIAADFYDLCLKYRIGEALRRARQYHVTKDIVWASLVMYGDPTLKLL